MTSTRPRRRMILHRSHTFFTDGRTFICSSPLLLAQRALQVTCTGRRCAPASGRTARAPPGPGPPAGCGCSASASCPRCARAPGARCPTPHGTWHWAAARQPLPRPRSRPSSPRSITLSVLRTCPPGLERSGDEPKRPPERPNAQYTGGPAGLTNPRHAPSGVLDLEVVEPEVGRFVVAVDDHEAHPGAGQRRVARLLVRDAHHRPVHRQLQPERLHVLLGVV